MDECDPAEADDRIETRVVQGRSIRLVGLCITRGASYGFAYAMPWNIPVGQSGEKKTVAAALQAAVKDAIRRGFRPLS